MPHFHFPFQVFGNRKSDGAWAELSHAEREETLVLETISCFYHVSFFFLYLLAKNVSSGAELLHD